VSRTDEDRERARLEREQRRAATAKGSTARAPAREPTAPTEGVPAHRPPVRVPAHEEPTPQRVPRPRRAPRARALLPAVVVLLAVAVAGVLAGVLLSAHHDPPRKPLLLPRIVKIVIPEGFTRAQIAQRAKQNGLKGNYLAASVRSPLLSPTHYGAPASTPNLEGFLFPATYELYAGASVQRLVEEQLQAFRENFGGAEVFHARALHVTPYQLLTIASMIEREAAIERDRPLIAAVVYNRLHRNMPLGIDATIRYALNDFSAPLTEAQLHIDSPYNTRLHTGLPPTPIANPGVASIKAAAAPAHVPYLYYVAGADGCGEMVFSTGIAKFEHNAAAYREAIAKNHGQVPSCHKR
jgi:hypothetical protein